MTARRHAMIAAIACQAMLLAACGGNDAATTSSTATSPTNNPDDGAARARRLGLPAGTTIPADAPTKGMFGALQNWPLIPLHAVLTPDGRVLSYGTKADGTQTGKFSYDVWNSADGGHLTLVNGTGTDLFCSSQVLLPAGDTVLISGGDNWTGSVTTNTGNNNSNLYSVGSQALARSGNMNRARWYATSTVLLNGEIFIQGGVGGDDFPEIRATAGSFRLMSGAGTAGLSPYYPRNFIAPDGRVFGFDDVGQMYYITTAGTGSITLSGQFGSAYTGADSSAAMFAPGRILQFGGNSRGAIVIDINGAAPVVTATASLAKQRRLGTATLLANGQVLASGGSSVYNEIASPSIVAYEVETWNPQTGIWTLGARGVKSRMYHSIGLLLPDATVLVGGGGAPGPENNTNGEIYYPPYLFTAAATVAARPVIDSAPSVVDTGRTVQLTVSSGRPISRVTFIATGAVTHGFNMNQRFVELPFNAQGSTLSVQIPARASDVPPGTWMVFVFDDAGVPSVAKMVRVNVAAAFNTAVVPVITSPGNRSSTVGTAVDLAIIASDPNNDTLNYAASGLPPGLVMNASSGHIAGTPTSSGSYSATVAASDGINSASATFSWTVNAGGALVLAPPPTPTPAAAGASASFTASGSGSNVRYSWDFGDGSPATALSTSANASHVFTAAGLYYVTVTAQDDLANVQRQTVLHQVFLATTANAPAVSAALMLEARAGANTRLWVANPDNDTVSVFDTVTRAKLAEITVGSSPRTVAVAADGSVWVANKGSASISVINASTLTVSRTLTLARGSQPHGMAMARSSGTALVALEASGQLLKINTATFATSATLAVGRQPRHVAVAADGSTAYVSRFITPPLPGESTTTVQSSGAGGEVVVVNSDTMAIQRTLLLAHSDKPDAENQGRGIPNYLGAAAISPDGTQAFVPSKQDNILRGAQRDGLALNFQSTVRAISSRIDIANQREDLGARIDHDNASVASAAAFDPLGVFLFVALETSREVAVIDAHKRTQLLRINVGMAPQALVVSADRRTLYVQNFMDRTVGVFDLTPLVQQSLASAPALATLATVASEKLSAAVLLGKQFFYDARDTRLARDRYMSCAACHNDGAADGRVWDLRGQGEGLRNTISLRGRGGAGGGHGRLHWSNNFDEVQDFEGQIRTLAGGTGLMSDALYFAGTRSQPLGDGKAGVSADLDALAAYVTSLNTFAPSPFRPSASTLTSAASTGQALFASLNCAGCHSGTAFTRSGLDNPADIGTLKATSGLRLNGALTGIDVPTLRDVWATAPYLHDGSAATLEAAIAAHAGLLATASDIGNLAAYLREAGSDESTAPTLSSSGAGLLGSYFAGSDLAGTPLVQRIEAVNFDWGNGQPAVGVAADSFSVRWTGTLTVPNNGNYRFRTISDDGVRLWVNGTQRINNWTDHAPTTDTSGSFKLNAGQRVSITLEFYERGGGAVMQLQWLRPGTSSYVAVPAASLNTP